MLHLPGSVFWQPNGVAVHICGAHELARDALPVPQVERDLLQPGAGLHEMRDPPGQTVGVHGRRPSSARASTLHHSVSDPRLKLSQWISRTRRLKHAAIFDAVRLVGDHVDLLFSVWPSLGSDPGPSVVRQQRGFSPIFPAFAET